MCAGSIKGSQRDRAFSMFVRKSLHTKSKLGQEGNENTHDAGDREDVIKPAIPNKNRNRNSVWTEWLLLNLTT